MWLVHVVGSIGWFQWVLLWLILWLVHVLFLWLVPIGWCMWFVHVVGSCGGFTSLVHVHSSISWAMWSVQEIDPNASSGWLCGWCMWLVHLLGSIGWCVWLVHVVRPHGSIGRFMWLV